MPDMAAQAPANAVQRWSTDHIDPADRFDYWRETLSAHLIGDTPETPAEHRRHFSGSITHIPVADTGVVQLRADFQQLQTSRTARDISDCPGDGVYLFRAPHHRVDFQFPDRAGFEAARGVSVMGGLDRRRVAAVVEPGGYRCDVLRLPSAAFRGIVRDPEGLSARILEKANGADALLHDFFAAFMRQLPRLSAAERVSALGVLSNLAILALRHGRHAEEPQRDAIRRAKLQAAMDQIARNGADPSLTPASVAAVLGVSIRQLHGLFEPTGKSFSRTLADARLARATHALELRPQATIAEIAFECGFESLPTFYRAFRAATGMTPKDLRASLSER